VAGNSGFLNDLWKFDGTNWTWVSGSSVINQNGVYGVKGTPAPANVPGARSGSVSWIDGKGNLWLFGGTGYDVAGNSGFLNDLWKFDGTNWTWVSGSNVINQNGVYGVRGTPAAANVPGARAAGVSWIDGYGNLWLFGGGGYDAGGNLGLLNDLWKFDGTDWTWVSGSNIVDQAGVYGVKGTPAPANVPGARGSSVSWIDGYGNLWLFGGNGYDAGGNSGYLNDLWKFDGTNWTWVSGSNAIDQNGVYGVRGTPASGNVPGARAGSVSWIDGKGNLWLFGGYGYDAGGNLGPLNDLWEFVHSESAANADLNGDGFVNFNDFALLASHWLTGS
jgi:N-acetylneuraminic acid mutarotase